MDEVVCQKYQPSIYIYIYIYDLQKPDIFRLFNNYGAVVGQRKGLSEKCTSMMTYVSIW